MKWQEEEEKKKKGNLKWNRMNNEWKSIPKKRKKVE